MGVVAGGLEPAVVGDGDEPAGAEEVGEPLVAVAEGSPPRMGRGPLVWKLKTPIRPAAVAAITIGARLIPNPPGAMSVASDLSKRKRFVMDVVATDSESSGRGLDLFAEALGPTDVHIAACDIWYQLAQNAGIEGHLVSRADSS